MNVELWIVIRPSADLPGVFTAHILPMDVVTQGQSRYHALAMAREAAGLIVLCDIESGRDPRVDRVPADERVEYERMRETMTPVAGKPIDECAGPLVVRNQLHVDDDLTLTWGGAVWYETKEDER